MVIKKAFQNPSQNCLFSTACCSCLQLTGPSSEGRAERGSRNSERCTSHSRQGSREPPGNSAHTQRDSSCPQTAGAAWWSQRWRAVGYEKMVIYRGTTTREVIFFNPLGRKFTCTWCFNKSNLFVHRGLYIVKW